VVCPLSRISTVITDAEAPKQALDMLRDAGVEVMIATETSDEVAAA
jgi:DeoR family ulaG and ulaABCDEF operon transcriptional repressor